MNNDENIYALEGDDPYNEYGPAQQRQPAAKDWSEGNARHCRNCGFPFGSAGGNFCSSCGCPIGAIPYNAPMSGYAVASLIMGIMSVLSCLFYGLPTLVFGPLAIMFAGKAKAQVEARQSSPSSLALATAGRVMGIVGLAIFAAFVLAIVAAFVFGVGSTTP